MADYFPVISRAVAGLETNTGEARRAVYDRARAAIVRQLRSIDPPLPEEDISRERMQLEEAIRKVEAGADGAPAASPAPAPSPAPAAASAKAVASSEPSPPGSPQLDSPQLSSPRPIPPRPAPSPSSSAIDRGAGPKTPSDAPKAATRDPAPARGELGGKLASGDPNGGDPRTGDPRSGDRRSGAPRVAPSVSAPAEARPATRADGRPIVQATGERPAAAESRRSGPVIALVALGVIALGVGAFAARGTIASLFGGSTTEVAGVETPAKTVAPADKPADQAANDAKSGDGGKSDDEAKSDDRLPQDSAAADKAPEQPSAAEPSAPAPETEVARAPEATAPAPAPVETPTAPPAAAIVAQRAVLYEEGPNQQSGEALQGTIVWRTESVSGGQSQPLETALRGEIDIPGRKVRATLTIRRNADATLPASHTIEIQFTLPDDFPNAGISNVPGVLMKADESARGAAVSGLSVRVTNGFFLIGLSNLETERTVNEQLLRDRGWIDIPILYDNGRRAVLTLEKGTPGSQAFQEAFNAWRSASSANPAPAAR